MSSRVLTRQRVISARAPLAAVNLPCLVGALDHVQPHGTGCHHRAGIIAADHAPPLIRNAWDAAMAGEPLGSSNRSRLTAAVRHQGQRESRSAAARCGRSGWRGRHVRYWHVLPASGPRATRAGPENDDEHTTGNDSVASFHSAWTQRCARWLRGLGKSRSRPARRRRHRGVAGNVSRFSGRGRRGRRGRGGCRRRRVAGRVW